MARLRPVPNARKPAKRAARGGKRKIKPVSKATRKKISEGLRAFHRKQKLEAKRRSRRAKQAAKTRAEHRAALERAKKYAKEPGKRLPELRQLAREQGKLPVIKKRVKRIDTVFRKGKRFSIRFQKQLSERSIVEIMHRLSHRLIVLGGNYEFFLGTLVLFSYGTKRLAGGSRKVVLAKWWAPDASEVAVDHVSTGTQHGLVVLLLVVEELLYAALAGGEGGKVVLEAIHVSVWNERTRKGARTWHQKHRMPEPPATPKPISKRGASKRGASKGAGVRKPRTKKSSRRRSKKR